MLKKYYIRIENIFPDKANDNALCNILTSESIFLGKKWEWSISEIPDWEAKVKKWMKHY